MVSPFNRAAQTVFMLSIGNGGSDFGSGLLTLDTTDVPQKLSVLLCPPLVLPGRAV